MRRRCVAFRQSLDYPEMFMPCMALVERAGSDAPVHSKSNGAQPITSGGFFCREHAKAYRELMAGILNESRESRVREERAEALQAGLNVGANT